MKKKLFSLLLMLALVLSVSTAAYAEHIEGPSGMSVKFTSAKAMESSFNTGDIFSAISSLEPGDDATFTITVSNEYSVTTDWYYKNSIVKSLEESTINSGAKGGGYSYTLSYNGPGGGFTLFSSENLGGEDTRGGTGLHQAVGALEEYSYLDTLAYGQSGTLTLNVGIDGEAEHNDYQDTQAQLDLQFAVDLRDDLPTSSTPNPEKIVKTGDESNVGLYAGLTAVSGLFVLLLALYGWFWNRKTRKAKKEEGGK